MPTLYVTPEEYSALGDDQMRALKATGEEVVVVADDAAAEQASWAEATGADREDHVPVVKVSFMPVSEQGEASSPQEPATATSSTGERQIALLEELISVQRENLAETRALRSELAKVQASKSEQPPQMVPSPTLYVPADTSTSSFDFSPFDAALKKAYLGAIDEDAAETIKSMIEELDVEINKAREEGGSG